MTQAPEPGWYPDTEMADTLRYWDGAEWTQHRQPTPAAAWAAAVPSRVAPLHAIRNFWARAFTYSGRATRSEYNWALVLFLASYIGVGVLLLSTGFQRSPAGVVVIVVYLLTFIVPWFALIARRCHDMNRSGVFGLLLLATGIGFLVTEGLLVFTASDPRGARFEPGTAEFLERRGLSRSRPIGIAAGVLGLLTVCAAIFPTIEIARVSSRPTVVLGQGPQHVVLPANAKYGLFFNDPQNLGYSESCSATDRGRQIVLADPGFYMTSSATDNLDLVFNTGSGNLVIDCQSSAQRVAAEPVPNFAPILIGSGATIVFGLTALVLTILWAARVGGRPKRDQEEPAGQT